MVWRRSSDKQASSGPGPLPRVNTRPPLPRFQRGRKRGTAASARKIRLRGAIILLIEELFEHLGGRIAAVGRRIRGPRRQFAGLLFLRLLVVLFFRLVR